MRVGPCRDPRGTSRTPSPSGTLTPPLNKLPPSFAVLQLLLCSNSLPALPYSLFEKRESPGDRLRGRSFQKRESFTALSKGVLLFLLVDILTKHAFSRPTRYKLRLYYA